MDSAADAHIHHPDSWRVPDGWRAPDSARVPDSGRVPDSARAPDSGPITPADGIATSLEALVVDASLTVRMNMRAILRQAGFEVTMCDSKVSALRAIQGTSFALIILATTLPDGDSASILRANRATSALARATVIMIAGEGDAWDRVDCLRAGVNECVGRATCADYVAKRAREIAVSRGVSLAPAAARAAYGRRILIVSGSFWYQKKLSQALREVGHDTVTAADAGAALDHLWTSRFDGVVLDVESLGASGLDICRRARTSPSNQGAAVMLLASPSSFADLRRDALLAGADEVVLKSPDTERMKDVLRGLLRAKAEAREPEHGPPPPAPVAAGKGPPDRARGPWGSLLDDVVDHSGLASSLGVLMIERACERAGVDARTMTPRELARALPSIQQTLSASLPPDESRRRFEAIAALTRRAHAGSQGARRPSA